MSDSDSRRCPQTEGRIASEQTPDGQFMISPQNTEYSDIGSPGVRYSQSPAPGTVSPMARDISKLLELAEERVARSERFLRTQRELIETLRRLGHETADANALLLEYDGLHTRFIAARDRLREEQEQSDVAPPTPSVSA